MASDRLFPAVVEGWTMVVGSSCALSSAQLDSRVMTMSLFVKDLTSKSEELMPMGFMVAVIRCES